MMSISADLQKSRATTATVQEQVARPDLPSRLLLGWLNREARKRRVRLEHTRPEDQPFTTSAAALTYIRRITGRPSFPMRLSALQVRRVLDLRVPGATELRPARLYIPYGRPRGVVLYMHGGGFVHCGLNSHHGICCRLARASGAAVLSYDYRLAPENKFPAAVDDVWAAFRWIASEAWRWGGEVAVAGDSAGGTLAAVLCQLARTARQDGTLADSGVPQPVMQILFYPATLGLEETPSRKIFAHGYFLTRAMMDWYGHQYAVSEADAADPRFAPGLQTELSGLPPAWIMTAECDPLRDEAAQYAEALKAAGNVVTYVCMSGTLHGFLQFYPLMRKGRRVLWKSGRALRKVFRKQSS
ncbi:alpha/beta hydrolase [Acetobacter conturbans]|uniref:Alpha/beta hydrolase fold domain-containing protein n=1 Tax=Acetobacter conturbans TaxID=1737472 RepID=A0ABX0K162_9PROT|nr:alpha/beta hydrolase [Acetobacter conturbans]NHN89363.1 alpha/beta hydrolase fold domain-containing protein [Acetobacter conturbans]